MEVQNAQTRIRIALDPVGLDRRAQQRLAQDQVREGVREEEVRVAREELGDEALEGEVVDFGVGVEELEVDVDEALLGSASAFSVIILGLCCGKTYDVAVVPAGVAIVVFALALLPFGHGWRLRK